jgi:hypothetical protein
MLWELEHDPDQMAVQIWEFRGYAAAKREFDAATGKDGSAERLAEAIQRNPMVTLVQEIEHELAAETYARLTAAAIARAMAEDV